MSLDLLLGLFAIVSLASSAALALRFRRQTLAGVVGHFDSGYLRAALPFFLLGLSGLLQSRADLYVVNTLLPRGEVARYQIFTNLLTYGQTVAYLILSPFVRSVYRLPQASVIRLAARLFLAGLLLLAPVLAGIWLLLTVVYEFALSPAMLACGGLFVLPAFCYLPMIYSLYRAGRQNEVLAINLFGTAASLLASVLLLPPLGALGALIASAAAQWLMLGVYLARSQVWRKEHGDALPQLS